MSDNEEPKESHFGSTAVGIVAGGGAGLAWHAREKAAALKAAVDGDESKVGKPLINAVKQVIKKDRALERAIKKEVTSEVLGKLREAGPVQEAGILKNMKWGANAKAAGVAVGAAVVAGTAARVLFGGGKSHTAQVDASREQAPDQAPDQAPAM